MPIGMFTACWKPMGRYGSQLIDGNQDALLWYKDLTQYTSGDFSIAVVQANQLLEDQSQVKVGPYGTLIGIYDGHGGPEASRFITNHLFPKIEGFAEEAGGMSAKVLKQAFSATEEEFLGLVDKNWHSKPRIASVGSCCLVGVLSTDNTLYIANLGDSRVVLGTVRQAKVEPVRLSKEHNAGNVEVREELKAQHPDDSHIVVLKQGVWRVKGIIQVSRSIGDVYLKKPEYNKDPRMARGGLSVSFKKPVLSAEPSLQERKLFPEDRFLIFASDGLWEHISDQEAVDIVQKYPRNGIAKRLVRAALQQAAKKREMRYSDLKKIEPGVRRYFHDDISVVVVYLDYNLMNMGGASPRPRSRKVSMDSVNAPLDIFSSDSFENMPVV
ncbi:hypothetical protein GOP47_0017458 [Adiantum capillus-veneris]|uniref:protein-serine/threonine phosphatase n=1 Tax=Adiantum capillus-veneris TaxID=13818 RepID=A0A9D4UFM7_ADICA|nr:hypothetical protein GOP47_0017458 [Adiantum capillus-veneris]